MVGNMLGEVGVYLGGGERTEGKDAKRGGKLREGYNNLRG